MKIDEALAALERGDEQLLADFASKTCRRPTNPFYRTSAANWYHFVTLTLWQKRRRLMRMTDVDNPIGYVQKTAMRLVLADNRSLFGKHAVYDESGRTIIGECSVGSMYRKDGTLNEEMMLLACDDLDGGLAALPFIPVDATVDVARHTKTARERRAAMQNRHFVPTNNDDEQMIRKAQMQGVTRRDMAGHLGWDVRRVERVWKRLYRRLHAQMSPDSKCLM